MRRCGKGGLHNDEKKRGGGSYCGTLLFPGGGLADAPARRSSTHPKLTINLRLTQFTMQQ
jgi:hypothetical protein